jgi:transmembrane sensor
MTHIKDEKELQELAHKYKEGTISEEERIKFDNWFNETSSQPLTISDPDRRSELEHRDLIFSKILNKIDEPSTQKNTLTLWKYIGIASAITLFIGFGTWYFKNSDSTLEYANHNNNKVPTREREAQNSYLKLSDGTSIDLDNIVSGKTITTEDIEISKSKDGLITYNILDKQLNDNPVYHELQAGVGEKIQILLADGTKVWLNTQTKLRFPSNFHMHTERKVFLSGEAYFEVVKNTEKPFRVQNDGQVVEVLGTQFNVSKYADEKVMKTTLIQGVVKINDKTIIKPNQQAISNEQTVIVKRINVSNYIDWIDGVFTFENENIIEVMRKVSRWYDLEVSFSSTDILKETFTGSFSRSSNIENVIKVLKESSGLNFKKTENKIIVSKI